MTKFDLAPADYRQRLAVSGWLRRVGVFIGIAVVVAVTSGATLTLTNQNLDTQIKTLQNQHAITTQQRTQLETLDSKIGELGRQWQLLTTLRSGAPAEEIFTIIDNALTDTSIWFQRWAFVRHGTPDRSDREMVNTGYFIVIPEGPDAKPQPAWDVETHIKIHGQAADHSALSRFVRALFEQQDVRDVRVQNSTLHRYANANVVDFELAVILNGVGVSQ